MARPFEDPPPILLPNEHMGVLSQEMNVLPFHIHSQSTCLTTLNYNLKDRYVHEFIEQFTSSYVNVYEIEPEIV